jgi:hypothetical protein
MGTLGRKLATLLLSRCSCRDNLLLLQRASFCRHRLRAQRRKNGVASSLRVRQKLHTQEDMSKEHETPVP